MAIGIRQRSDQVIRVEGTDGHRRLKAHYPVVSRQRRPAFTDLGCLGGAVAYFRDGRIDLLRQILCHGRPAHLTSQTVVAKRFEKAADLVQQRFQWLVYGGGGL